MNNDGRWEVRLENRKKWGTTEVNLDTENVSNVYKWHAKGVSSYISLFTNDIRLLKYLSNRNNREEFQNDFSKNNKMK